ncbi:hypothetical protein [Salinibaculum rarum]|uniref:hypothetical protein n=1 Tax=Salinibaculum rarum TaxID=3058903 RepID=UPI00265F126E|nr:hypothetical protein [Salinibaculum sp. KK48]
MSTYTTTKGTLVFNNDASFDDALDVLREGGWINDNEQFVDEDNRPIMPWSTVHHDAKVIGIPCAMYRNLSKVLDSLVSLASAASIVGCNEESGTLFLQTDNETVRLDTVEWAKLHAGDASELKSPDDPNVGTEEFTTWKDTVREEFFTQHSTTGIADVDVFSEPITV